MTAWIYDQGRELELFATREVAGAWIEENDPEGGAFNMMLWEWKRPPTEAPSIGACLTRATSGREPMVQ
jgi:hypothetical protein